jgi:hypothetical protein
VSDRENQDQSDQNIVRIDRGSSKHLTYHGPVEIRAREEDINVVTFTGSEESDVLHAAGAWMAEHPYALLIGINWYGEGLTPRDFDPGHPPLHRLDLSVALTAERSLT